MKPEHVHAAVAEYDRVGQEAFLDQHGFARAKDYLLVIGGSSYDSKAVLGVAYTNATGQPLGSEHLSASADDAATVLGELGFRVDGPDEATERPAPARTGTYREPDGTPVPFPEAQPQWVAAARERLLAVAKTYHAVTTYKELAAQVQADTGIHTRMLLSNWIGGVLGLVAEDCARRGEPLLSALCINQEGSVGPGYAPSVAALRETTPDDPDTHAAHERLACYRHFGATMPKDGGRAALSPTMQRRRDREASQRPERRGAVCPTCFVELPVTGACMNCS